MEPAIKYSGHVLLYNLNKPKNIGTIIRSAAAFNFKTIFLICKTESKRDEKLKMLAKKFNFFGNKGTSSQMDFHVFQSIQEAKLYFVEKKIYVCGVEITEQSRDVSKREFLGETAFFLGCEGDGIHPSHRQYCDHFVYIPQYTQKTASLNVACAASIVFHHFAIFANYEQVAIIGEKFQDQNNDSLQLKDENENIQDKKVKDQKQQDQLIDEKDTKQQNQM